MSETIILQRVIPHYRAPLFRALYTRFGWITVTAANPPGGTFLKSEGQEGGDHIRLFPFEFTNPSNPYSCRLPFDAILAELKPKRVISEFSMRMNIGTRLPLLRAQGRIDAYALWSHGWNTDRGFSGPAGLLSNAARLAPMALADLLLTYGEEGKAWLERWLPWKKVIAIGNTLDVDAIQRTGAGVEPVSYGDPQLLAAGRLTHEKRFDRMIAMFAEVKRQLPHAALTIIGDGPERKRLETLARASDGGVTFLGALYDEKDLAPHFKGADFFVLTGAAGLSVNHALAYGLPVLAYRQGPDGPFHHPEIEYVVEGVTGLYCEAPGDAEMTRLIVRAHGEAQANALRRTIPAFVDEKLRLRSMVDQFALVDRML